MARVLRPLVGACLRSGVTFPMLADLLRTLFVEVASQEIATDPRGRSDSRISVLTGIHRKGLRRQRAEPMPAAEPAAVTLNSRLLGRWLGDPAYLQADGSPRALPRSGPAPSFDALVAGVTKDVHPRTVLDGLLQAGVVVPGEDGALALRLQAFVPSESGEARMFFFARNLHDHAAAAAANVAGGATPPFLDRSVHYDELSPAAAAALEAAARGAAERTLLAVNREALRIAEADEPTEGRRRRVNFGVYVFVADEPDAS